MSLIRIAGYKWSPLLVGYAGPGRGNASELLGYYSVKAEPGRPTLQERSRWIVNVWSINAVYSLFDGDEVLYIGEGVLGDRIAAHYKEDEFSGRWDSFTWLSPSALETDNTPFKIIPHDATRQIQLQEKELIETFELLAICLADPNGNRQVPSGDKSIKWLKQARSQFAPRTLEEKIDEILEKMQKHPQALGVGAQCQASE